MAGAGAMVRAAGIAAGVEKWGPVLRIRGIAILRYCDIAVLRYCGIDAPLRRTVPASLNGGGSPGAALRMRGGKGSEEWPLQTGHRIE